VECAPGSGFHNPAPDQFYVEVVDPSSYQPLPDGEDGMVLLTHLRRRGTVLLRYALGDTAALSRERCPHCGSWTERLVSMPKRIDGLVKIKGALVNPEVLTQAAESSLGGLEYQFEVSAERLTLRIASPLDDDLAARAARVVKSACGVTPQVQFVEAGALAEGWKVKRVVS